ncbi:MAG TPA: FecR domain-containing protein [Gemmatimonadaceae bacterium]|nr:FecR domain-containing protein [Gemmatimonadaceae bacterium]
MSTPVSPSDGGAPIPLPLRTPLTDEAALHEAFVAEYPTLAAEARAELGAEAAVLSPKVVEGAFVRAWDARAKFQTPAELHKFLIDDVHHAAARALSRRAAAHRFAGHEASHVKHANHVTDEINMEQSWAHVLHALHGEAHSPQALAEAAALSRHEAAEHIAVIEKSVPVWKIAGVIVLVAGVLFGAVALMNRLGADAKIASAVNASDARVVPSLPAQIGVVTLDDGSVVRLAPESKLSIPTGFGPDLRAVKLEGAGTFQVAPGQKTNFRVHTRNAVIIAKGTKFTVRNYEGDSATTVVVQEGSVDVRVGDATQSLTAGGSAIAIAGAAPRAATPAESDEAAGWTAGTLAVSNRPLRDVLPLMRRWYGLTVSVPQDTLLTRSVTMRASLDSSRQAIRGIEQSTGLEFGYIGQNMVFRERAAKGAKK